MQFKTKIIASLAVSTVALVISILLPIIPCRKAPSVPPYLYKWSLCSLNPDSVSSTLSIKEYFGYTSSLTDSYFLVLLIAFAVAMLFFHFVARKKK